MSSSNQRPANRGFRSVLRCAISHYRQSLLAVCTRTPPGRSRSAQLGQKILNTMTALGRPMLERISWRSSLGKGEFRLRP